MAITNDQDPGNSLAPIVPLYPEQDEHAPEDPQDTLLPGTSSETPDTETEPTVTHPVYEPVLTAAPEAPATPRSRKGIAVGGAAVLLAASAAFLVGRGSGGNEDSQPQRSTVTAGADISDEIDDVPEAPVQQRGAADDVVAQRFTGDLLTLPPIQDPSNPEAAAQSVLDLMGCYLATLDDNCIKYLRTAGELPDLEAIGERINVMDENGNNYRDDQQFLFFPDPNDPPQFDVIEQTENGIAIQLAGGRMLYTNVLSNGYPWGHQSLIEQSPAEGILSRFTVTIMRAPGGGWQASYLDFYLGNNPNGNPYNS